MPDPSVRTDLAIEQLLARKGASESLPGIDVENVTRDGVAICRVHVRDAKGVEAVGKPLGHYVTLDAAALLERDTRAQEQTARLLADELARLLRLGASARVLVVGLGNANATPDALGPKVVAQLLVTRHLKGHMPPDLAGDLRSLAALAPGVLGTTGIESGEIIRGVVDRIHPDAVIAVDALASRSIERILRTIQIADTGIQPGSGVGNHRVGVNRESLGVPVVAVGVPTVVHAATIASDTIDLVAGHLSKDPDYAGITRLAPEDRQRLIAEVVRATVGDLMVTPKQIDALVEDMARVIAAGINAAVHPRVAGQELLLG